MKKLLTLAAVAALTAGVAAGPASAAKSLIRDGRVVSYSAKLGTLTLANAKAGRAVYTIKFARCGVNSGGLDKEVSCRTLGAAKYKNKRVTVLFHRASDGTRIAELLSVSLLS